MNAVAFFQTFDELTGRRTGFDVVAKVSISEGASESEALEFVYRRLQNLDGSWSLGELIDWEGTMVDNPDHHESVTVIKPLETINGEKWGHRSMMVGDVIALGEYFFKVDSFGFSVIKDIA